MFFIFSFIAQTYNKHRLNMTKTYFCNIGDLAGTFKSITHV